MSAAWVPPTKERLASALREIGLEGLAMRAAVGEFDDYESAVHDLPKVALVGELHHQGTAEARALIFRVQAGEFDNTAEEAEAWYAREGEGLLQEL